MKKISLLFFINAYLLNTYASFQSTEKPAFVAYKAVVTVPMVNALTQPIDTYVVWSTPKHTTEQKYALIGHSPKDKNDAVAGRITQLVYGDVVTVVDQRKDEVLVETMWHFNETSRVWIPRSAISLLYSYKSAVFPTTNRLENEASDVIVLNAPWKHEVTGIEYPIGSRFKLQKADVETDANTYAVFVNQKRATIPYTHARIEKKETDCSRAKSDIIAFARAWALQRYPYTQGGATADSSGQGEVFTMIVETTAHGQQIVYDRKQSSGAGFDPAHANTMLAILAGLPTHAANTTEEIKTYAEIQQDEPVTSGDIFWHKGYSYRIDRAKDGDYLLGARGYSPGYGTYDRLPVSACYKDMNTIDDILAAKKAGQAIVLLRADGSEQKTVAAHEFVFLHGCPRDLLQQS